MNKKLGLAVAGALVAFASTANAGITIPAGDWTVDIGGNVNAYYTNVSTDTTSAKGVTTSGNDANTIGTGLLPAAFGIGAKTRQNDLDIAFQFSFFTGTSSGNNVLTTNGNAFVDPATGKPLASGGAAGNNTLNIRQAFVSFGDASWGTIKAGRDLGIFGSDAILSDMTLLGVGTGGPAGGSSTLGRIGSGYIYADWKGQMSYTSPNWNGFQVTAGVMENFKPAGFPTATNENMGYEAKATYDFAANDVTGRVWLGGLSQKTQGTGINYTSQGMDVGAKLAYQGFGLVGYYYNGDGLDSQNNLLQGLFNGNGEKSKDSGGYVQGTFVVPTIGTKLGASWGTSMSKAANGTTFDIENESWIVGAYHPLTKSLNLVAEYTQQEITNSKATGASVAKRENDTISLGAILFF
jgi:predicted porin